MGLHSIFALLASLSIFKWRPPRVLLLVLWGVLPWLYLNFGSSSLSHFTALPNADRYIEFCYVPLFLVVGFILDQWVAQRPSAKLPALACLTIVAATGFWCAYVTRQQGWRTADAAFLRRIAGVARQTHTKTISIQGDTNELWEQEMAILAPGMTIVGPGRPADLVIGPDAAGLPSVVSVPAKR